MMHIQYAMLNEASEAGHAPRLAKWQAIMVRYCSCVMRSLRNTYQESITFIGPPENSTPAATVERMRTTG